MAEHGTLSRYTNCRCRCEQCRIAWREWHREYQRELRRRKREGEFVRPYRRRVEA